MFKNRKRNFWIGLCLLIVAVFFLFQSFLIVSRKIEGYCYIEEIEVPHVYDVMCHSNYLRDEFDEEYQHIETYQTYRAAEKKLDELNKIEPKQWFDFLNFGLLSRSNLSLIRNLSIFLVIAALLVMNKNKT